MVHHHSLNHKYNHSVEQMIIVGRKWEETAAVGFPAGVSTDG